jgi:Protein of unknown function (DUF4231)
VSSPDEHSVSRARLEDQLAWYDRKSVDCARRFKVLKGAEMIAAAAIPVVAVEHTPAITAAVLGALVLLVEGFLQLNQYQQNWITYRATAEALKHEKFLYLARADVYAHARHPDALLAERIERLISQEHARWETARRQTEEPQKQAEKPA